MENKNEKYIFDRDIVANVGGNGQEWCVRLYQLKGSLGNIQSYLGKQIVKIVSYEDVDIMPIAFDTVSDEYQLKAKYRGQSYVRVPVFIDFVDGKYNMKLVDNNEVTVINAYLVVDKREVKTMKRAYRKLDRDQIISIVNKEVESFVKGFNMLSSGNMFQCEVWSGSTLVQIIEYVPRADVYEMEDFILDQLTTMSIEVDKMLREALKKTQITE